MSPQQYRTPDEWTHYQPPNWWGPALCAVALVLYSAWAIWICS